MSPKKRRNQSKNNQSRDNSKKASANSQPSNQLSKDDNNRPRLPFRTGNRSNTKRVGERSEASFLDKMSGFGFGVARPWGDSERYDFILDNGLQLLRVQIKCTDSLRAGAYETRATYTVGKRRAVYTKRDIDFLAAHACPERSRRIVPLDLWYVMPVEVCTPQPMLRFYPHRQARKMRLEKYKEAWRQLEAQENANGNITIQAAADETLYGENDPCDASAPSASRAQRSPWHKPQPWPIPRLQILFNRKPKPPRP